MQLAQVQCRAKSGEIIRPCNERSTENGGPQTTKTSHAVSMDTPDAIWEFLQGFQQQRVISCGECNTTLHGAPARAVLLCNKQGARHEVSIQNKLFAITIGVI